MNSNRIGRFSINADIVYSDDALEIFKQLEFIPLLSHFVKEHECFIYTGISPRFDEFIKGLSTPEYIIAITSMETDKGRIIAVGVDLA